MAFLLEDIAKIEGDRRADIVVEHLTHIQQSGDILHEPKIGDVINSIMDQYIQGAHYYVWNSDLVGVLGVFTEAFLNAGMWGNKDVPGKKIQVYLKYGLYGSVIIVEDEGSGFDYLSQIERVQKGEKHLFSHHGGGFRKFNGYEGFIAYHGCGNRISIATRIFSEEEFHNFRRSPIGT